MAEYGQSAPLSYNKYLRIPEVVSLQTCLSDPVCHDELLFITIHQTYELWFKQILHELDLTVDSIAQNDLFSAERALLRVNEIERILVSQIHILETMTPMDFLEFRDQLKPASGFQSSQFRELEFISGIKSEDILKEFEDESFAYECLKRRYQAPCLRDAFFDAMNRSGLTCSPNSDQRDDAYNSRVQATVSLLSKPSQYPDLFRLQERLIEHDEAIAFWRSHHVLMVERMLGTKPGTGGSTGANYLRSTLTKRMFPELWEARTHLELPDQTGTLA